MLLFPGKNFVIFLLPVFLQNPTRRRLDSTSLPLFPSAVLEAVSHNEDTARWVLGERGERERERWMFSLLFQFVSEPPAIVAGGGGGRGWREGERRWQRRKRSSFSSESSQISGSFAPSLNSHHQWVHSTILHSHTQYSIPHTRYSIPHTPLLHSSYPILHSPYPILHSLYPNTPFLIPNTPFHSPIPYFWYSILQRWWGMWGGHVLYPFWSEICGENETWNGRGTVIQPAFIASWIIHDPQVVGGTRLSLPVTGESPRQTIFPSLVPFIVLTTSHIAAINSNMVIINSNMVVLSFVIKSRHGEATWESLNSLSQLCNLCYSRCILYYKLFESLKTGKNVFKSKVKYHEIN